jgi:hypothetical protein
MKKTILPLFLFLTIGFSISAQNLTLSKNSAAVLNGDTITINGAAMNVLQCLVDVSNNTAAEMSVKCRRSELSMIPGSTNSICWGGQCWPENISQTPDPTIIPANDTTSEFSGDYNPHGFEGISIIKYRFFNMNNLNDSVILFAKFVATAVGVNESSDYLSISPAFPNPSDKAAYINYKLSVSDNNARIIVTDMVGNEVKRIAAEGKDGKARIDTYDMSEGIYFYSFILNNKVYYTKKLVVVHR